MRTWYRPWRPTVVALLLAILAVGPTFAADRDGDGLSDGFERKGGVTDPRERDTDGDGVIDSAEDNDGDRLGNLGEQRFGTHPGKADTDGDGKRDGAEDHDGDGLTNAQEQDQRPVPEGLRPTLARAPTDISRHKARCLSAPGRSAPNRCVFGDKSSDTTVILMGDSHATMWLPAMKRIADRSGWKLVTLLKGACLPVKGMTSNGQYAIDGGRSCRAWLDNALEWLRAHPADLVVITQSESYRLVDRKGATIPAGKRPRLWKSGMQKTLAAMPDETTVLLLGDVPNNAGNPVICLRGSPGDMSACQAPRRPPAKRPIEIALRKAAEATGEQFRTLYDRICTYDPCPLVQGNVLMWRDDGHLTTTFAKVLTPSLRAILRDVMSETVLASEPSGPDGEPGTARQSPMSAWSVPSIPAGLSALPELTTSAETEPVPSAEPGTS